MIFQEMNDEASGPATFREQIEKLCVFSDESWEGGEPYLSPSKFEAGEYALRVGDVTDNLHLLVSGCARAFYLDSRGREFNQDFLFPVKIMSSLTSLLYKKPSLFAIQALTSCSCLTLKYQDALMLGEKYPEWKTLHIRYLQEYMILKEKREADFLLLSAVERYQVFLTEFSSIIDSIPNYHIASYLGITDVGLSRIRARLRTFS